MDWTNAVSTSAAAVVSFLLMTWLVRSAQAEPEIGEEGIVLRYGRGARVLLIASAFVLVGLGIGFAATVLFGDPDDKLRRVSMFAAPISTLVGPSGSTCSRRRPTGGSDGGTGGDGGGGGGEGGEPGAGEDLAEPVAREQRRQQQCREAAEEREAEHGRALLRVGD
ncbi:MAG: hypothetical protein ACO4CZ_06965, partial [Planctomycetota bacterium]